MRPGRSFLAVGSAGALAALVPLAVTAPATEGCQTHACDQSNLTIGVSPDGGVVGTGEIALQDDKSITWESAPLVPAEGSWTVFSGNETITFAIPPDVGIPPDATPVLWGGYVAAQLDAQANNVIAAGQLAEFFNIGPTSISVFNDTCATYYVRIWVQFALPDAGAPELDAPDDGAPLDASEAGADSAPE
jgi:hypothetical protein